MNMNMKNVVVVTFMLLWVGACVSVTEGIASECEKLTDFKEELTFKTKGHDSFELHTVATNVQIIPWDKDEVSIELTGKRPEKETGKEIETDVDSDDVEVSFKYDGIKELLSCYQDLKVVVKVPKSFTEFDLRTVSGGLKLEEHGAKELDLVTVSGDISLDVSAKEIYIKTVSGDITFKANDVSELDSKTVSGDVEGTITSANDIAMSFKSVSGDCDLFLPEKLLDKLSVKVRSLSGNYSILGAEGNGKLSMKKDENKNLKFHSVSGTLTVK